MIVVLIVDVLVLVLPGLVRMKVGAPLRARQPRRSLSRLASAPLIERYYAKAKKAPPLMRQVLTKPLQRTFCAFFGGDWLALVSYPGEQPHPSEQIASALPEPRLYVKTAARTAAVAAGRAPSLGSSYSTN